MAKSGGLTAAVLSALADGSWKTTSQVVASIEPRYRLSAPAILSQKASNKAVERRGEHRKYEYRLAPVPPTQAKQAKPELAAPAYVVTADGPAELKQSLGVACARPIPQNPGQGRVEDVLAAVLAGSEPMTLPEILSEIPPGWSRTQVISGMTEGSLAGWLASDGSGDRVRYRLAAAPPVAVEDPLAKKFDQVQLRERMQSIEGDLTDLITDVRASAGMYGTTTHLSDARTAVRTALKRLPE